MSNLVIVYLCPSTGPSISPSDVYRCFHPLLGQSSAFTNRRCFGDGGGSTQKIRVSSPSVRKVMGSRSCSRNEAGGTALRSSETPLSSLKHRKPNNISNNKTLISEATAASEMPNLLHRRVPAPVLLT